MTSVAILNRIRISRQTLVTALTAKLTTTGEATRRITKKNPNTNKKVLPNQNVPSRWI